MLRIHFSPADVARTRLARGPDAMWELVLSLHVLVGREGQLAFGDWRRHARARMTPVLTSLFELNPPAEYFPDFLTPDAGTPQIDEGVDAVLHTPRARLGAELRILAQRRPATPWLRDLGSGEARAVKDLGNALRTYHERVLAPFWPKIAGPVEADRALRGRALLDSGTEGLLESLRPQLRWNPPVLEADYPVRQDLHLGGRGLRLVPSFFCWRMPVTLLDTELTPILVYPVEHDLADRPGRDVTGDGERLAALIGRTRAAVLHAVAESCTTTELARRVNVSAASASQHATVLRDAGLVATRRRGGSVLHSLTPLGSALLRSGRSAG